MIVGAFVQAVLHEVAIATFDILEIPVWGREADAADKLAGFIMVQFGKEVALKVMIGAAWFFEASDRTWTGNPISPASSRRKRSASTTISASPSAPIRPPSSS